MASHQRSLDIDPSLNYLVRSWESSDNKVRRPPNAFMLFGKDNRKRLAEENPHVSNKVISEMLGKRWREAPSHIKEEYYKNARIIGTLHRKMFPGYHYSPVEARRKKAEKLNKSTEAVRIARGENPEEKTRKVARHSLGYRIPRQDIRREKNSQEGETFGLNDEVAASVEYVPNNLENFVQLFDEETAPDSENQPTDLNASLRGHESGPSTSEQHLYFSPSFTMGVSSSSIPSKLPSPFCSGTEYCPGSTSSDYCENTTPPYYPYCNSRLLRAPLSYQRQDDSQQGFHTVPYYTSAQYRPTLGHQFDRSAIPYYINSGFGYYGQVNTSSQASESEFAAQNSQAGDCSRDERLSNPCRISKDGLILEPSYQASGYLPSCIQLAPEEEMSNCFPQFQNPLKRIHYGYESTQTRRDYGISGATQDAMNISFESADGSLEIDVENETSSSCDSESETAHATNLINDELSMPTKDILFNFGGLVSSAIQDVGMVNPVTPSPSNPAINNEITNINSKPDNEAETEIVVKEHGLPDILDANVCIQITD